LGDGSSTYCGICRHPRASWIAGIAYQTSVRVGKNIECTWGNRTGSAKLGGRGPGVDLGTDFPDDPRTLPMYVCPSRDLVKRHQSLRMPGDRLSEEWEK
jgi:hypothetical protein